MDTLYLEPSTMPIDLRNIATACFPEYRGRKFKVAFRKPTSLDSYWDGGSRDYYALWNLDNGKQFAIPSNHPAFERGRAAATVKANATIHDLPNIIVVERSYFCGKDSGITFYADPARISGMLPAPVDLTAAEKTVLEYTARLKNTYGGRTDIRFSDASRETGITRDAWDVARLSCQHKGFLRANGSITPAGRNAR